MHIYLHTEKISIIWCHVLILTQWSENCELFVRNQHFSFRNSWLKYSNSICNEFYQLTNKFQSIQTLFQGNPFMNRVLAGKLPFVLRIFSFSKQRLSKTESNTIPWRTAFSIDHLRLKSTSTSLVRYQTKFKSHPSFVRPIWGTWTNK